MLAKSSCVNTSCIHAGVSRRAAYTHYDRYPVFRQYWDEALVVATEALEAEARLRAFDRADPASATMLIFLLKAHKPAKFRDNYKPAALPPADEATSGPSDKATLAEAERSLEAWRKEQREKLIEASNGPNARPTAPTSSTHTE